MYTYKEFEMTYFNKSSKYEHSVASPFSRLAKKLAEMFSAVLWLMDNLFSQLKNTAV